MLIDALSWYAQSLSAFWVSLAGGGLFKLIMIWCFIYWIFCRPRRRAWRWRWRHHHGCCGWHGVHCGCTHGHDGHSPDCECTCGGCACGADEAGEPADEAGEPADEPAAEATEADEAPAEG